MAKHHRQVRRHQPRHALRDGSRNMLCHAGRSLLQWAIIVFQPDAVLPLLHARAFIHFFLVSLDGRLLQ